MGRRRKRLDPNHPLAAFATELQVLRDTAGKAGAPDAVPGISKSTYYAWLSGSRLPNRDEFEILVRAWGGDVGHWMQRRREAESVLAEAAAASPSREAAINRPTVEGQEAPQPPVRQSAQAERPLGAAERRYALRLRALRKAKIENSRQILMMMGFGRQRANDRTALALLAFVRVGPESEWSQAKRPMMRTVEILDWMRTEYAVDSPPSARGTLRRSVLEGFIDTGIAVMDPDDPNRPANSPRRCYQVSAAVHELLATYDDEDGFADRMMKYLAERQLPPPRDDYAVRVVRQRLHAPSPPSSSATLISKILTDFCDRYAPNGKVLYVAHANSKERLVEPAGLSPLGITADLYDLLPDVVVHIKKKHWVILVEAVTTHGPIDLKRRQELAGIFSGVPVNLSFVSAFPSRNELRNFLKKISWDTEAWCADDPSNLISFGVGRSLATNK
ncbi:BsuBI/PstI family type II restriction endonuclease [Nocardia sp. NPDC051321]|uniref:BsuBI/PstI family type II restriction endonuclease n=1 Tax=Nocardia sp. NPDC051321 TaxID=3364323 RepID=UPI0037B5A66A